MNQKINRDINEFFEQLREKASAFTRPKRGLSNGLITLLTLVALFVYFFFALR